MKTEKKFKLEVGCKFTDRTSGIVYVVRDVSPRLIIYRSAEGQREVSSCSCAPALFEAKIKNRTFEIMQ